LRPGPFVHRNGATTNLNDLLVEGYATPWIITDVSSINHDGVIGASARTTVDNHSRAVLLVPVEIALGDLDGDGLIAFGDLLVMLADWGACQGCPADLDGDGTVSFVDLVILLGNWS